MSGGQPIRAEAGRSGQGPCGSNSKVKQAIAFLYTVDDIEDFPRKIGMGSQGFLRPSCQSHLRRLFDMTAEETEQAINTFLGKNNIICTP